MDNQSIFFQDEIRLLGYGESDSYGAWVKVNLADPEQLSLFRGQPSGKKLGKRFACVLVEIDDNEQPKRQNRTLSQEAYLMIMHENYYRYALRDRYRFPQKEGLIDKKEFCNSHLKWALNIESKTELDNDDTKANLFRQLQKKYSKWVSETGLDKLG